MSLGLEVCFVGVYFGMTMPRRKIGAEQDKLDRPSFAAREEAEHFLAPSRFRRIFPSLELEEAVCMAVRGFVPRERLVWIPWF
jgi:hypothetical protein